MSTTGVPSSKSAPLQIKFDGFAVFDALELEQRQAQMIGAVRAAGGKHAHFLLPPKRGGRTSGDQPSSSTLWKIKCIHT